LYVSIKRRFLENRKNSKFKNSKIQNSKNSKIIQKFKYPLPPPSRENYEKIEISVERFFLETRAQLLLWNSIFFFKIWRNKMMTKRLTRRDAY
jgi:hypothetical protein